MGFPRSKYSLFMPGIMILACSASVGKFTSAPTPGPASETPAISHRSRAGDGTSAEQLDTSSTPTSSSSPEPKVFPVPKTPTEPPPMVDKSIASVPIEDIVFDTFDGGLARLSEASDSLIDNLRDKIKPIYEPRYVPVEEVGYLNPDDVILGYASPKGNAFAYPVRTLNFHEIVNDVIDGVPVLIPDCPLCASGVVYNRELDGQHLLFGNTSALFESDLVMFDHLTGSYWFQVLGEAVVGPLTGKRLTLLPSRTTTWREWKELHPDTQVLSRNLGLLSSRTYDRDPFRGFADAVNRGGFAFPVSPEKLDDRLLPGEMVLTIQVGEINKVYQVFSRPDDEVINDEVGGEKVVVIVRTGTETGSVFFSSIDGRMHTFRLNEGAVEDAETESRWDGRWTGRFRADGRGPTHACAHAH